MSQSRVIILVLIALYYLEVNLKLCVFFLDSCAPLQRRPAGWFSVELLLGLSPGFKPFQLRRFRFALHLLSDVILKLDITTATNEKKR